MSRKKFFRQSGAFTLVELMVVLVILSIMVAGIYMALISGESAWLTTDTHMRLQTNLRMTLEKVSRELRESGSNSLGVMQLTISDNTGISNSDVLRFSIPIVCEADMNVMNATGDVAYWGAPLVWGCTDWICMDADGSCGTVDYKYIEYQINANNQLVRRVLDDAFGLVREDIFAHNITDFQASLGGDQNSVTLTVIAARTTEMNRLITSTNTMEVFLRNRG